MRQQLSRVLMLGFVGAAMVSSSLAEDKTLPPGIYVETPSDSTEASLDKVAASRPTRTGVKDVAKTVVKGMLSGGLLGGAPKMVMVFSGARSSERLPAQPMFQFHFDPQAGAAASSPADMASMMAMMGAMSGGDEIPATVSRPQEFALVRLQTKGEEREMEATSDMKPNRKQTVACRVRQLGPHVFRVAPEQPLPPGEYGFVAVPKHGGMDRLWEFGVD